MNSIPVISGQGWYDIAIIYTGNPDNASAIARANNAAVDDTITPGTYVYIPDNLTTDVRVSNFFLAHHHPATGADVWANGIPASYGYIGKMTIGVNFLIYHNNTTEK